MGGVGGKEETTNAEFFGTALVHFVGTAIHEFVLVWFGVSWEHSFEFHGLSGDHLKNRLMKLLGEMQEVTQRPCKE